MKLIAYCRVSTEGQRENTSLEGQFERIQAYSAYHRYDLVEYPEIDVQSGTHWTRNGFFCALWKLSCATCPPPAINKRASADEVIALLQKGCSCAAPVGLDGMVAYDMDRLGRDAGLLLWLRDFVERKNKEIHILTGGGKCDTSSPQGKWQFAAFASMAQYIRDDVIDKLTRGRYDKARSKKYAGGRPPLGYRIVNHELIVDDAAQRVREWVCEMTAQGIPYRKQAALVKAAGYRNSKGNCYDCGAIYQMSHYVSKLDKWMKKDRTYNYMEMNVKRLVPAERAS